MTRSAIRPLLALPLIAAVSLGCAEASASPADHEALPAWALVLHCADGTTYTGTAGQLRFASREGQSSSGNERFGATITLDHVVVTDGTQGYRAIGAANFDGGTKANSGTVSDRGTFHIHVLDSTGPVASVRISARLLDDGSIWINDHGDCDQPT